MQKPITCKGCDLEHRGLGFSRPEGTGSNGVLVIGESLGREEYLKGTPFVKYAQAGSALEKAFMLSGTDRQDHKLWNIVACQPPNNKLDGTDYGEKAIEHCKIHFQKVLAQHVSLCSANNLTPVILALGNVPLKVLTGVSGDPKEKQSISNIRGYVLPARDYPGVWIISSYHPSFIRRGNANLFPALMDDIAKAGEVARSEFDWWKGGKGYNEPSYLLHPSLQDAESFANEVESNTNLALGMDIETEEISVDEDEREGEGTEIRLIQFSLNKRLGIAVPCEPIYYKVLQRIFQSRNIKLGFNWWGFDEAKVRAAGFEVNGQVHDLMVMFSKYSPGLRKHLQAVASYARFPFPWKHMYGSNLEYYGCADVDALHWIWEWLPGQMKELGVWRQYEEQVYNYKTILDRGSRVGIPVDDNARTSLSECITSEKTEIQSQLEQLIPIEIRSVTPKRKDKTTGETEEGYKKPPKELVFLLLKYKELKAKLEAQGKTVVSFAQFALRHGFVRRGWLWAKLQPLKMSKDQVIRYIKWKRNQLEDQPKST